MLPTCPDLRYAVNRGTFVGSRGHNRDSVTEAEIAIFYCMGSVWKFVVVTAFTHVTVMNVL